MAERPLVDRNRPQETNPAEEIEGLRQEYEMMLQPGHARRAGWIMSELQRDGSLLMLGKIKDELERRQAEGRCQAYTAMLDRDDQVRDAWERHIAEEQVKGQPEELEGGDFGVSYEAAQ